MNLHRTTISSRLRGANVHYNTFTIEYLTGYDEKMAKCIIQIKCKRFVIHHKLDSDQLQEIMFIQWVSFLKVHWHYVYWKTALSWLTDAWWRSTLVGGIDSKQACLLAPSGHKVQVWVFVTVGNTCLEIDVLCISRTTYEEGTSACKCT